jgi:lipopolysaccharide export system permease protein
MILQRYIGINLVRGWLLVLLVLAAVFGLIGFIEELDKTKRAYDALAVARYTLMTLPNQLVGLAPVIALLGSIVALAGLDRYNELTVISVTGFSLGKLVAAIALPTLVLMGLLWACMEYVTPQMQQAAEEDRHRLRQGKGGWIPGGGVWSNDGRRYIHLGRMSEENEPRRISLFEFDESGQLYRALKAKRAQVSDDRRWLFQHVREKLLVDGEFQTRTHKELEIANLWARDELPSVKLRSDSMNLSVLYRYAQYLASTGQPEEKYVNAFWQQIMMPLTVLSMVLLATPISASVTAGRDRSFGFNIGIGAVLGILFYLGVQIIFALGSLLGWRVQVVAALPAALIFIFALLLMRRMRW